MSGDQCLVLGPVPVIRCVLEFRIDPREHRSVLPHLRMLGGEPRSAPREMLSVEDVHYRLHLVSVQMGPQIRLVQNNDTLMAEKIQTTIINTIPLWKNQMVMALGLAHSTQAMQAERAGDIYKQASGE